ncbi:ABC transporter ATP-binding protein [Brevibacillus reuszeri]|uniref:ABC transporter ATP-binding protein n=1 Tax=Brevibacillus reuszeri TaxID=54915 RepID=UPI000CCC5B55|nr:ABC transporter ATP-binding protein [Brevibacillus reuszeri]
MSRDKPKVLEVRNVKTRIKMENREYAIIEDIDFHVDSKETVGIVGESGCGKSMTALSIMGLLPENAIVSEGEIRLQGANLLSISKDAYRKKRGKEMSMIFQEPMSSLNPVYTIGFQLIELLREHTIMSKSQAKKKAIEMLQTVGIPRPHEVINEYPHQLSGGMRQRVMIAMGLACNPDILIADEPTTALDVTIQAQILELMKKLQEQFDMAILLITHDLGVVAEVCDRVIVMYAGQIVEEAPVLTLFETPSHPYTKGLIASTPKIGDEKERLHTIEGTVPQLSAMPSGCRFSTRCSEVTERCMRESPPLVEISEHVRCRCWLYPKTSGVSV